MRRNNQKIDIEKIKTINFKLLEGQVDILLKALELYNYNLKYVIKYSTISEEDKKDEISKVIFTYEQILSSKIEQLKNEDKKINSILSSDSSENNHICINLTESKIIDLINKEKYITEEDISKILELSKNCVYKNLRNLKNKELHI